MNVFKVMGQAGGMIVAKARVVLFPSVPEGHCELKKVKVTLI